MSANFAARPSMQKSLAEPPSVTEVGAGSGLPSFGTVIGNAPPCSTNFAIMSAWAALHAVPQVRTKSLWDKAGPWMTTLDEIVPLT